MSSPQSVRQSFVDDQCRPRCWTQAATRSTTALTECFAAIRTVLHVAGQYRYLEHELHSLGRMRWMKVRGRGDQNGR